MRLVVRLKAQSIESLWKSGLPLEACPISETIDDKIVDKILPLENGIW